jgi:ABC-2 type transport system permease protein
MTAPGAGRLIDQGYRSYDGPRGGRGRAIRSVTRTTLWRALGIHRPARAKVFPLVAIVLAYVPTAVYVGVAVIGNHLESEGGPGRAFAGAFIPTYASNEVQVLLAVLVVACFVAPEVLCPDRRNGMLGLYLASPLDRVTYLWAKAQAILVVVAMVTIGPSLILLVGYSTQGYGPAGVAEWFSTLGRILAAGLAISLLYTVVSLAISSITSRKAVASAAFLGLVIGSSALAMYLVDSGSQSPYFALADLAQLPYEAVFRIFGEPSKLAEGFGQLSGAAIFVGYATWLIGGLGVIAWRYRRIEVAR